MSHCTFRGAPSQFRCLPSSVYRHCFRATVSVVNPMRHLFCLMHRPFFSDHYRLTFTAESVGTPLKKMPTVGKDGLSEPCRNSNLIPCVCLPTFRGAPSQLRCLPSSELASKLPSCTLYGGVSCTYCVCVFAGKTIRDVQKSDTPFSKLALVANTNVLLVCVFS